MLHALQKIIAVCGSSADSIRIPSTHFRFKIKGIVEQFSVDPNLVIRPKMSDTSKILPLNSDDATVDSTTKDVRKIEVGKLLYTY